MDKKAMTGRGNGYLQGATCKEFTPITVSADFGALQRLILLSNAAAPVEEPAIPEQQKAA
jgi:hypothetical protein